jgi:pSer/pThr/pTyr-binding forkhead associated (FHA) protein
VLEDVESTRIVAPRTAGERYVLQFSTGESFVVAGTGLIGRNPAPEPGEYVDDLVPIFDVGKSVSKSHVEFGQESGRFWVSDRYSTNGTVVRQPDTDPVRCEPGKRYMIARGSRVEIGEQFFIVS